MMVSQQFFEAIANGQVLTARQLMVQHIIDLNNPNTVGQRPLHVAVECNQPASVALLLIAGADATLTNMEALTAEQ